MRHRRRRSYEQQADALLVKKASLTAVIDEGVEKEEKEEEKEEGKKEVASLRR